jgi:RNA polymerase sigma-70 factor (ECF subfamily)
MATVDEWFELGQARWPDVRLPRETFAAHVRGLGLEACAHPADLYLACACATGQPAALAQLEREVLARVPAFVARVDADPHFADEVTQSLRERLLIGEAGAPARIAGYGGRGPLGGWVRVAAVRTALDRVRQRSLPEALDDQLGAALSADGAELALLRARYGAPFREALGDAMRALTTREATLLRLHYADGLPLERLARVYRVSTASASRWVTRARERLVELTFARLGAQLAMSGRELTSLTLALRSQIDLSLSALLRK